MQKLHGVIFCPAGVQGREITETTASWPESPTSASKGGSEKKLLFAEATNFFSDPRLLRGSRLLTPIVSFAFFLRKRSARGACFAFPNYEKRKETKKWNKPPKPAGQPDISKSFSGHSTGISSPVSKSRSQLSLSKAPPEPTGMWVLPKYTVKIDTPPKGGVLPFLKVF